MYFYFIFRERGEVAESGGRGKKWERSGRGGCEQGAGGGWGRNAKPSEMRGTTPSLARGSLTSSLVPLELPGCEGAGSVDSAGSAGSAGSHGAGAPSVLPLSNNSVSGQEKYSRDVHIYIFTAKY